MKKRLWGIGIVVVLAFVLFLFNRGEVQVVKQDNLQLQALGSSGYQLNSTLRLHNPNFLSSTLVTLHEEYKLNNVTVAILNQELNQGIPGLKESAFPLSIRFTTADLQAAVKDSIFPASLPLTIAGKLEYHNVMNSGTANIFFVDTVKFAP